MNFGDEIDEIERKCGTLNDRSREEISFEIHYAPLRANFKEAYIISMTKYCGSNRRCAIQRQFNCSVFNICLFITEMQTSMKK